MPKTASDNNTVSLLEFSDGYRVGQRDRQRDRQTDKQTKCNGMCTLLYTEGEYNKQFCSKRTVAATQIINSNYSNALLISNDTTTT